MNSKIETDISKLKMVNTYEKDYVQWVEEQASLLQEKQFDLLDLENLIEEVIDLSRRERKAIKNYLLRFYEHILKLHYWDAERELNRNHWRGEIKVFRDQIIDELKDSPSLKNYLKEVDDECWIKAVETVSLKIGKTLSNDRLIELETALNPGWFPNV